MEETADILRRIPQVEKLLQSKEIRGFIRVIGHNVVAGIIKEEVARFREILKVRNGADMGDLINNVIAGCELKRLEKLQRVINGTGIIIHTNLGRSPLGTDTLDDLTKALSGYCNLELYLPEKKRGRRGGFAEGLLSSLAGAEDALIVNNNAACVFLILKEFGDGREVIVSRGELVQIGGGFRIPDIMKQTGASLVEVGTTNITTIEDYRNAVNDNTAMIFSAHRSNFRMEGFSSGPEMREIAALKSDAVLYVRDLGSGNVVHDTRLPSSFEVTVEHELSQGADLVCFSGDKLLGACQAGIIVGRRDLIARLKKNPLLRMIRVDKITYFLLQETLLKYVNGQTDEVKLWSIIHQNRDDLGKRINRLMRLISSPRRKEFLVRTSLKSTYGGGSMPGSTIESTGLRVRLPGKNAEEIIAFLTRQEVPVVGYIEGNDCILDFMTIFDADLKDLARALNLLIARTVGAG